MAQFPDLTLDSLRQYCKEAAARFSPLDAWSLLRLALHPHSAVQSLSWLQVFVVAFIGSFGKLSCRTTLLPLVDLPPAPSLSGVGVWRAPDPRILWACHTTEDPQRSADDRFICFLLTLSLGIRKLLLSLMCCWIRVLQRSSGGATAASAGVLSACMAAAVFAGAGIVRSLHQRGLWDRVY